MQDLRLIGVHEDGAHLLLVGDDGARFRLPLDEALRAAARRDRPRLGQLQIEIEGGARPREVQAMVRAGLSTAEIAERSGWSPAKIAKYEGPILAEREHVANLARAVRMRHRGAASGSVATLEQRVVERLVARAVTADRLGWDSWRREGPEWTVVLTFAAGGRERQAMWSFDVADRTLTPRDDEARWLSEDEPAAAAAPIRDAPVYDVEAEGGVDAPRRPAGSAPGRTSTHAASPDGSRGLGGAGGSGGTGRRSTERERSEAPLDLVSAMRERSGARGRRMGRRRHEPAVLPLDEAAGENPATEPAAAHGSVEVIEVEVTDVAVTEAAITEVEVTEVEVTEVERADAAVTEIGDEASEGTTRHTSGFDDVTEPARATGRRGARTPVPSWDDIVFGATSRKPDDEG